MTYEELSDFIQQLKVELKRVQRELTEIEEDIPSNIEDLKAWSDSRNQVSSYYENLKVIGRIADNRHRALGSKKPEGVFSPELERHTRYVTKMYQQGKLPR